MRVGFGLRPLRFMIREQYRLRRYRQLAMTCIGFMEREYQAVIPAKAGIHLAHQLATVLWIPAFAGMTTITASNIQLVTKLNQATQGTAFSALTPYFLIASLTLLFAIVPSSASAFSVAMTT